MTFTEFFRRAAVQRNGPNILLDALRRTSRVWVSGIGKFKIAPARVGNCLGIRSPTKLAKVLAVVFLVGRDLACLVTSIRRRLCNPEIPHTLRVENPGDTAFSRSGRQFRRKRCAQELFERRRLLSLCCGRERQRSKEKNQYKTFHQEPPKLVEIYANQFL